MARTRTRLQLRTAVRQRADVENSQHVTETEVNELIDESIASLHSILVEGGEDDFTDEATFSTVAGTDSYAIATALSVTTYYKLRSLHAQVDGTWRPLSRWTLEEWSALQENSGLASIGAPSMYRVIGTNFRIYPTPQAAYSIKVFFVPVLADLSDDGKTFNGRDGWEEWVVLDAAIKIGIKEESDVRPLTAEREKIEARIRTQAKSLDQAKPHRVRDVTNSLDPFLGRPFIRVGP